MVSATTGDGLPRLVERLAALIPAGPWLYPEDQIAGSADPFARRRDHAREADRAAARRIALSGDRRDRGVEGPGRRLGSRRADNLRHPREPSQDRARRGRADDQGDRHGRRKDISEAHGATVHLFLHVKVREKWLDDPERYRAMGLDFPKG